jgi:hypothetical protein
MVRFKEESIRITISNPKKNSNVRWYKLRPGDD